jgi:autotransporter-associated beta strand protein
MTCERCIPTALFAFFLLTFVGTATAQSGVWLSVTNGTWGVTNNWSGGTVATGADNTADFSSVDPDGDVTVQLDSPLTIGQLVFGDLTTASAAGWRLDNLADPGNVLTLTSAAIPSITVNALGQDKSVTISADMRSAAANVKKQGPGTLVLTGNNDFNTGLNRYGTGFTIDGGSTVEVTAGMTSVIQDSASNGGSPPISIGGNSSNNTLRISGTGRMASGQINIGPNLYGNNRLLVSSPGSSGSPTLRYGHNGTEILVGGYSSSNSMVISNGAYVMSNQGGGGNSSDIGKFAGAEHNTLTVTGTGSTWNRSNGPGTFLYVGQGGSNNTALVSAGGSIIHKKLSVGGKGGGKKNTFRVTGANSTSIMNAGNNSRWETGGAVNSFSNCFVVEDNAYAVFNGTSVAESFSIGKAVGADHNRVTISGLGSLLTVTHAQPLTLGGYTTNSVLLDTTASGNRLDVRDGATANMSGVCVYLMGSQSAFSLGNGTNISSATVGKASGFPQTGIFLSKPDSELTINSGLLKSGVTGPLVSGPGTVTLLGTAYISTTNADCSIDSVITGGGELIKIDPGTLTLSATNTHVGATVVTNGILRLTHDQSLSDSTAVWIWPGASIDLAFSGVDTIGALYIDGVLQYKGLYGKSQFPSHLTGTGYLRTLSGGTPRGVWLMVQ